MPDSTRDNLTDAAGRMMQLATQLYPLHRSITGEGTRATLRLLADRLPLEIHEVPTGTQAFDWEVPQEWNIQDAFIKDEAGERVVDYQASNLHVVSYSRPIDERMTWRELREHVHTLPDRPLWIPYRSRYFRDDWGFCITHNQFGQLDHDPSREYHVRIDASFSDGSLTYGELFLPGETADEVLISTHVCHPSLANDNLSGIVIAAEFARHLSRQTGRLSYRFIFVPATIGAITWLSCNEETARRVKHGLVLTCLGDKGPATYKRSRRGNASIDRAAAHVLRHASATNSIRDFEPFGYDERQFCSPGFNLPMGVLMRTPNGEYPEYHTSADDLSFIDATSLGDSLNKLIAICNVLENDRVVINQQPKCEPRLGRYGLYTAYGEQAAADRAEFQRAVMWVLNQADGSKSLLDIAERAEIPFDVVQAAAEALLAHDLVRPDMVEESRDSVASLSSQHECSLPGTQYPVLGTQLATTSAIGSNH